MQLKSFPFFWKMLFIGVGILLLGLFISSMTLAMVKNDKDTNSTLPPRGLRRNAPEASQNSDVLTEEGNRRGRSPFERRDRPLEAQGTTVSQLTNAINNIRLQDRDNLLTGFPNPAQGLPSSARNEGGTVAFFRNRGLQRERGLRDRSPQAQERVNENGKNSRLRSRSPVRGGSWENHLSTWNQEYY